MTQQLDGMFKAFTAGEALPAFTRVKMSGATIVFADDEEKAIGITQAIIANGAVGTVKLIPGGGTHKCVAADAISAGAAVYAAADGEVESSGTIIMGYAMEASTADQDVIECHFTD